MRLDFKKFKKVAEGEHSTTLKHPAGHSITLHHKFLSPENHAQLKALPLAADSALTKLGSTPKVMAKGGEVDKKSVGQMSGYPHSEPTPEPLPVQEPLPPQQYGSEASPKPDPKALDRPYAKGGEVDPTQEHLLPGDALPNKIEKSVVSKEKQKFAEGGTAVENDTAVSDAEAQAAYAQALGENNAPKEEPATADPSDNAAPAKVATDAVPTSQSAPAEVAGPPEPSEFDLLKSKYTHQMLSARDMSGQGFTPEQIDKQSTDMANSALSGKAYEKSKADKTAANKEAQTRMAQQQNGVPEQYQVPSAAAPQAAPTSPPATLPGTQPAATTQEPGAPNAMQQGAASTSDMFNAGLSNSMSGFGQQAQSLQELGQQQADVQKQLADKVAANQKNYQDSLDKLTAERTKFQQDIKDFHIEPNHFLGSMDTEGRIATVIGLMASGLGSGMSGQPNLAADFLKKQIDNDINAQKMELGKKENLLAANMKQFGNLHDATAMTRIQLTDWAASKMQEAAAKAQSGLAQAALADNIGKLQRESAATVGSMAMRSAIFAGVKGGTVPPNIAIMAMPQDQQKEGAAELAKASEAYALRDNLISAFDKIAKTNTVANRVMNPIESMKIINSAIGMSLPELSKATAGRFTEGDAKAIANTVNTLGSDPKAYASQRQDFVRLASKGLTRDSFPILRTYGIDPRDKTRYDENGNPRIAEVKH